MSLALSHLPETLVLRSLPHPAFGGRPTLVFGDWKKACEHLRDHLLTAPECHAWAAVVPDCAAVVDLDSADARWRYVQEAMASRGVLAQGLYDLYSAAIVREAQDARRLRWFCSEGGVTVALGTSGILLVIEDVLKTAFLPGQGDPHQTPLARGAAPRPAAVPRQAGWRPERGDSAPGESGKEKRSRQQREAAWTSMQQLYYRVFRLSVRFVRDCHTPPLDGHGSPHRRDYALLKGVLPPQSRLKFRHWLELRDQCRRG